MIYVIYLNFLQMMVLKAKYFILLLKKIYKKKERKNKGEDSFLTATAIDNWTLQSPAVRIHVLSTYWFVSVLLHFIDSDLSYLMLPYKGPAF